MADLFVATPPGGGQPVVVKAIRDDCVGRDEMLRLFEREAALLPLLDHPSIVHVDRVRIDVWNSYIAMELLDGCDLRDLVRVSQATGRRIPLRVCLRMILDVLDGLQYAHELVGADGTELGVVHRDVSPSNIMLTLDGRVKLLDFGIAKMRLNTPTSSRVGTKGKGCYMAPEQCQGQRVDSRTDIYAVGAVLYELSTSRRAFNGNNEMAVLHSILEGQFTPPTELLPGYPTELEVILRTALSRDGEDRYQSALEMAAAIREAADRSGVGLADRSELQAFIGVFSALDVDGELSESLSSLRSQGERQSFGAHSNLGSTDVTRAEVSIVEVTAPAEKPRSGSWGWVIPAVAAAGVFGVLLLRGPESSVVGRVPLPSVAPAPPLPPVDANSRGHAGGSQLTAGAEPELAPPRPVEAPVDAPESSVVAPRERRKTGKPRRPKPEVKPPEPPPPKVDSGVRLDDELRPPKI